MTVVEKVLRQSDIKHEVWRRVPTNPNVLSDAARSAKPEMWQTVPLKPANISQGAFERYLYRACMRIERSWAQEEIAAYALSL